MTMAPMLSAGRVAVADDCLRGGSSGCRCRPVAVAAVADGALGFVAGLVGAQHQRRDDKELLSGQHRATAEGRLRRQTPCGAPHLQAAGRIGAERTLRTSAQDDRGRFARRDRIPGCVPRQQFGVDVRLAHPASDQLPVLRAKIKDDDRRQRPLSGSRRYVVGSRCRPAHCGRFPRARRRTRRRRPIGEGILWRRQGIVPFIRHA